MSSPLMRSSWARRGTPARTTIRDTARAGIPVSAAIPSGPHRNRSRAFTTASATSGAVRVGLVCGREDRSARPTSPPVPYRVTQVRTHVRETPIAAAMCACGHPPDTFLRPAFSGGSVVPPRRVPGWCSDGSARCRARLDLHARSVENVSAGPAAAPARCAR